MEQSHWRQVTVSSMSNHVCAVLQSTREVKRLPAGTKNGAPRFPVEVD